MRVLQSTHLQGCLHFFTARRGCRSPIYPLCQPVSNGNAAFSGLNMHCGGQPCLLCPLVIPSGDSTQSYHIKHTAEEKKRSLEGKASVFPVRREQQTWQALFLKDESEWNRTSILWLTDRGYCFTNTPGLPTPTHAGLDPSPHWAQL